MDTWVLQQLIINLDKTINEKNEEIVKKMALLQKDYS